MLIFNKIVSSIAFAPYALFNGIKSIINISWKYIGCFISGFVIGKIIATNEHLREEKDNIINIINDFNEKSLKTSEKRNAMQGSNINTIREKLKEKYSINTEKNNNE